MIELVNESYSHLCFKIISQSDTKRIAFTLCCNILWDTLYTHESISLDIGLVGQKRYRSLYDNHNNNNNNNNNKRNCWGNEV